MSIAIYPGSFDPITIGHLDIIQRSSVLYEKVFVVIMENSSKRYLFTKEERLKMLEQSCMHFKNVVCCIGSGLTIDFAKAKNASVIIRGIRAVVDYEYELQSATANMMLNDKIETVFLLSRPHYSFLSSSAVKEIAKYHGDLTAFVEPHVQQKLIDKFK